MAATPPAKRFEPSKVFQELPPGVVVELTDVPEREDWPEIARLHPSTCWSFLCLDFSKGVRSYSCRLLSWAFGDFPSLLLHPFSIYRHLEVRQLLNNFTRCQSGLSTSTWGTGRVYKASHGGKSYFL